MVVEKQSSERKPHTANGILKSNTWQMG